MTSSRLTTGTVTIADCPQSKHNQCVPSRLHRYAGQESTAPPRTAAVCAKHKHLFARSVSSLSLLFVTPPNQPVRNFEKEGKPAPDSKQKIFKRKGGR